MKILVISHEYPPIGGGGANACMNLAREYDKAGHIVKIITVWYEGQEDISTIGNVTICRVRSKRKKAEHCSFYEMLDYLFKAKPVVKKLVQDEDFDICQVFFGIPSGPLGLYIKKRYGIPYVVRFGGGDIPGFQDRFASLYRIIGPAIKVIWNNADALVANSEGLKRMALDFYDKNEVIIIPNGVDINAFSDLETDIKEDRDPSIIRLLFVSRLIERKGLQDVLPLLKQIQEKCVELGKKIELDVVGGGPYADKLKEIVKRENIEDMVAFLGQKTKSELAEYYSKADIFIFPSRKEGMPNVVLEAMSYGLPVVMTTCEGSDELIQENGFACSIDEFKDKIIELIKSPELRYSMGNMSIQLVKESFSWKRIAEKYLALFESVIG